MPDTFTDKEYAKKYVVYGVGCGNGRAVVVEYRQGYPHRRIPHCKTYETVHRILRGNGSFPTANTELEESGVKAMFWQQCKEA